LFGFTRSRYSKPALASKILFWQPPSTKKCCYICVVIMFLHHDRPLFTFLGHSIFNLIEYFYP
jgi:hypothetical protein